jgi:hypothetical protein
MRLFTGGNEAVQHQQQQYCSSTGDATEPFEIGGKFLAFRAPEGLSLLQKCIRVPPIQIEQFTDLSVRNLSFAVRLDDQGLKSLARELFWLGTKRPNQRFRN